MYKAIQELKTRAGLKNILVGFLLLAAAIGLGFNSHDRTTSSATVPTVVVVQQEPQLTIQKQPPVAQIIPVQPEATDSRKQYKVLSGDSLWTIANKIKPQNVEVNEYVKVLKVVNKEAVMHPGTLFDLPNATDLKEVTLPEIELLFSIHDEEILSHIKKAEGTSESQSVLKRRLLGGKVGPSFKNGKFYPYRDSTGNYTIGYGHYIGKGEKDAAKYRNGISKGQAHNLLIEDMKRTRDDFILLLQRKRAIDLTIDQQRVLYEMTYTMGADKLAKFNKLWKSVENSNARKFKKEIKNSLWYNQVGSGRADMLLSSL